MYMSLYYLLSTLCSGEIALTFLPQESALTTPAQGFSLSLSLASFYLVKHIFSTYSKLCHCVCIYIYIKILVKRLNLFILMIV
jgi:hypothetical protein